MPTPHKHVKKDAIVQFRINTEDKDIIQKAAKLKGLEPSIYMRSLILETAKKEIKATSPESRLVLSAEEWEKFIDIMEAPIKPNKHLKKAFADYKKKYG